MKTTIKVRFTKEGFHYWPSAPPERRYLRELHRHLFHFLIECRVTHNDRQIEFHNLLQDAQSIPPFSYSNNFGTESCESIAKTFMERLAGDKGYNITAVEVWEDGECGARVETGS